MSMIFENFFIIIHFLILIFSVQYRVNKYLNNKLFRLDEEKNISSRFALTGNRTRVTRVGGEHSTIEPSVRAQLLY